MNNGSIDTTVASALLIPGYSLSVADGCFELSLSRFDELRVSPGVGVFSSRFSFLEF